MISYVFPPYYGIGGRRWAKHADELTKLGFTVHVICAKNPGKQKSLWTDIVERNPDIVLHQLPGMFPKVLLRFEHHFLGKLAYKIWTIILPLITKGSYLDRTIFWKGVMLRKAKQIILEQNIKKVICSGGPFGAMYYTTLLKNKFNEIVVINDLRDPWTWGPNWGFPDLSPSRIKYESMLEKSTIENSDLITVPTAEMKNYLDRKYPLHQDKIQILHHFFDKTEIPIEKKTTSKKVRLILYGTIYHHIPELIEETARVIANYKETVMLDIFTDKIQYKGVFEKHAATNVTFYDQLPPKELFKLFKNYDYVFLMIPGVGVDHISTKFYEIIYSQTPFLVFCKSGLGPKFIVENRLGIHADLNALDKVFGALVQDKEYKNYNTKFDLSAYSLENNARQIESMFLQESLHL